MIARIRSKAPVRHFLKEWRLAKGKTQQQLADLLDTDKGQVSNWESNKRGMTMEVQSAIAYALNIEPQDLFRDPEQPSPDELLRRVNATPEQRALAYRIVESVLMTGTDGVRLIPQDIEDFDGRSMSPAVNKSVASKGGSNIKK